jgi:Fe2+ transport system protein FeoA
VVNKKLSDLAVGERGIVLAINAPSEVADQLLELGIGVGETLSMEGQSPFGDPIVIGLMNYRLSLRKSEGDKVILRDIEKRSNR